MAHKYFISATSDTDISPVVSILHQSGIQPVLLSDIPFTSGSAASALYSAISDSDAFLAVLSEAPASSGVLFEAGLAVGLGKPVLVVAPRNVIVPDQLTCAAVAQAPLEDSSTLRYAVETLQKARVHEVSKPRRKHTKGKILHERATHFKEMLTKVREEGSPVKFETLVKDILKEVGVRSVVSSTQTDTAADLAIWVEELSPIMGNPLLVELRLTIPTTSAGDQAAYTLLRFLAQTTSKTGLVLYDQGIPQDLAQSTVRTPQILFIQLAPLLDQLASHTFASVVRSIRNQTFHRGTS